MSPERATAFVAKWVQLYTANLPASEAHRRREEISADLADHIAHHRSAGVPEERIAREILSRMLRGALADVSWRQLRTARSRSHREHSMPSALPVLRVTTFVVAVLAIPLIGMAMSDDVVWSATDFLLAGVLLTVIATCIEAAARRRGNPWVGGVVAVLGIAAAGIGEVDDAPGLLLLGALMIAAGGSLAYRRTRDIR